jgi:hypothetical protein
MRAVVCHVLRGACNTPRGPIRIRFLIDHILRIGIGRTPCRSAARTRDQNDCNGLFGGHLET